MFSKLLVPNWNIFSPAETGISRENFRSRRILHHVGCALWTFVGTRAFVCRSVGVSYLFIAFFCLPFRHQLEDEYAEPVKPVRSGNIRPEYEGQHQKGKKPNRLNLQETI
jgi:hypothetical protein